MFDETKTLKWWRCKKLPTGRSKKVRGGWETKKFTFGQLRNMEKYYEVNGPFDTLEAATVSFK